MRKTGLYVSIDDIANVKPNEPQLIISDGSMKSIKNEGPASVIQHEQPKRGKNKSFNAEKAIVPVVRIKNVKLEETGVQEIIEVEDKVKNRVVDPTNESVYSDVVTHTRKLVSSIQGKKFIQVYVSNAFITRSKTMLLFLLINFCECVWYMHSEFIVLCLDSMEETAFFQQEYKDIDMSWIAHFTNFPFEHWNTELTHTRRPEMGKRWKWSCSLLLCSMIRR